MTGSRDPLSAGRIILVGAGPGDPDLLTLAGQRAISDADVIVYDRLINPARLIYAGKRPGPMTQEEINQLLCKEASRGQVVVRLKGGDPFVFGRGGEEALAAAEARIPFSVIPGVTAATAVPAYAGIPVTHRGLSSTLTVLTGHEDPTKGTEGIDWDALAQLGGTIVLLMGVDTLDAVCRRLMQGGLRPDTPAAVIESGTTDAQRLVRGTLCDIAERAQQAEIAPPATTVIGNVAALADQLRWWAREQD
jgi:uroporphyrin-III C-methyltransferase